MKKYFLFILLYGLVGALWGQQLIPSTLPTNEDSWFRNINVAQGMLNNEAWRVQALDDRTLLVGFDNMFQIYDGAQFRDCPYDYRQAYALKAYAIGRTYVDKAHRVWMKNYVNLFCYNQRQRCFCYDIKSLFLEEGIMEHVEDVFFDADSMLWATTSNGNLWYNGKVVYTFNEEELKEGVKVLEVAQAGNDCLLFFSNGVVKVYDKQKGLMTNTQFVLSRGNFLYTEVVWTPVDSHRTLIATNYRKSGGVMCYDTRNGTLTTLLPGNKPFVKMIRTPNEEIIVLHVEGYERFDKYLNYLGSVERFVTDDDSFTNRDLLDATIDWQGGLWMASFCYGLFYTHPQLNHQTSILVSDAEDLLVKSMMPYGTGIVCNTNHGVYLIEKQVQLHEMKSVPIFKTDGVVIHTLSVGDKNQVYACSDKGIYMLEEEHEPVLLNHSNVKGLPKRGIRFALPIDGQLLVNSGSYDLGWIDQQNGTYTFIPKEKFDERYHNLHFAKYNATVHQVVVGAKFGVFQYDVRKQLFNDLFGYQDSEGKSLNCNAYLCDSKGNSWFGTNAGLFCLPVGSESDSLKKNHFFHLSELDGLAGNGVQSLICDEKGLIWAAGPNGLASICVKDVKATPQSLLITRYNLAHLLEGGQFTRDCMAINQGLLYLGGSKGVVVLKLGKPAKQKYLPLLSTASVFEHPLPVNGVVDGRTILDREAHLIKLRYNENSVNLHFSACNYMQPEQMVYRFRFKEEEPWITLMEDDLKVNLSQLSPGGYTLFVEARNDDGSWSDAVTWKIRIQHPWWWSWWMWILYLCLFLGTAYGLYYLYRERHQLMLQLKNRRNQYLVQAQKVKPEEIAITSRDEAFLQRAVADVEAHLGDASYNVELFAQNMSLTRSSLYRRLQSISGQVPTEFIRTIRIRRAEQLLRESGLNVDEVAQLVGFRQARYFTRYFKEVYGVTPSEYKRTYHQ